MEKLNRWPNKSKIYDRGSVPFAEIKSSKIGRVWKNIHARCLNPKERCYKFYGARGIGIAAEFHDFGVFKAYLESLPRFDEYLSNPKMSLDRIDNDKGYERGNLRFADKATQSINKRTGGSKTGFRGVTYYAYKNKYDARIGVKGKKVYLGSHNTAAEAAMAYNQYVLNNNLPNPLNSIPSTDALKQ